MLYFAYGSNLSIKRMFERCPETEILGKGILLGYDLCFQENNSGRIVANLRPSDNGEVVGVLYHISQKDMKTLDRIEGHPYVYEKTRVSIEFNNRDVTCFTYIMPQERREYEEVEISNKYRVNAYKIVPRQFGIPEEEYLCHIRTGYDEFGIRYKYLHRALRNKGKGVFLNEQVCEQ